MPKIDCGINAKGIRFERDGKRPDRLDRIRIGQALVFLFLDVVASTYFGWTSADLAVRVNAVR